MTQPARTSSIIRTASQLRVEGRSSKVVSNRLALVGTHEQRNELKVIQTDSATHKYPDKLLEKKKGKAHNRTALEDIYRQHYKTEFRNWWCMWSLMTAVSSTTSPSRQHFNICLKRKRKWIIKEQIINTTHSQPAILLPPDCSRVSQRKE